MSDAAFKTAKYPAYTKTQLAVAIEAERLRFADLGRVPTTCIEHAYGTTERLSFQIKVF